MDMTAIVTCSSLERTARLTSVRSVMCTPFAIVVVANVSLVTQGQVMNASKKLGGAARSFVPSTRLA